MFAAGDDVFMLSSVIAASVQVGPMSCTSYSTPTLTPMPFPAADVAAFSEGEAVAVVKTWLSQITYDRVETGGAPRGDSELLEDKILSQGSPQ